ncbi:hypothetical protein F383_29610 [Gossypium arboreum]|uniref:Uncharacterized protein n=1 Tax=Gossypium arboreum TaxID=29729 RepID=A0A0B0PFU8_GOSAR|nr:hypothetical protein F383_29610 [Gossypium arboreum]
MPYLQKSMSSKTFVFQVDQLLNYIHPIQITTSI